MGLLDQLNAYIQANTPRSTRPVAKPSTVINQGLLNPNKYNAPAANRFKDSAFGLLGVVPGVGDAASAAESADLFNRGEKFAGSMAALGALPLVPALGGMFIGKGAKTWDAIAAQQADELLKAGVDPREVWKQTGTAKFADGMLRQEIPDNLAAIADDAPKQLAKHPGRKQAQIFSHDELYNAYPDSANLWTGRQAGEYGGSYSEGVMGKSDMISLGMPARNVVLNEVTGANLHEMQHAIQNKEGWAKGGNMENASQYSPEFELWLKLRGSGTPAEYAAYRSIPNDYDAYQRLAGEAEARLTQARMNMTMPERLQSYPYDMLDVPQEQLIVRGLLGL